MNIDHGEGIGTWPKLEMQVPLDALEDDNARPPFLWHDQPSADPIVPDEGAPYDYLHDQG